MNRFRCLAVAVLFSGVLSAQTVQTFPGAWQLPNDPTFGTAANHLAKLNAFGQATILARSDTSGLIGLVVQGAGTSGFASIASNGLGPCAFDGATTAGDYVQPSATVAGDCHDVGASYPISGQIVGRATSTNASAGSYVVVLFPGEDRGSTGNGGSSINATSILGIPLNAAAPTAGQAWVFNATANDLEPVAVPYWKKYTVTSAQLVGFNALTGTVTLLARANRQKVCGTTIYTTTGFAGPGISGMSVTVGDTNATTNFYTPQSVNVIDNGDQDFNVMGSAVGSSNVTATFTSVGANLSVLTTGSADIDVCLVQLP